VVYRVTPTRLYVADPNYPGRLRTVAYDPATGVLGPYSSGDNAGAIAAGGATSYARFAYIPAGASSSDAAIAAHWAEFENGKSGDGAFPAYALEVWTGKDQDGNDIWEPLGTSYATPDATLRVRLVVPGGDQGDLRVFRGSAPLSAWGTELTVELKDGVNDLGFYEMGVAGGAWKYVDFQRVAVTPEQIDQWNLPTRPTKTSDSRSKGFGDISVELDAISPEDLRELVQIVIEQHLPKRQLEILKVAEASEREIIKRLVGGMGASQ